MIDTIAFYSSSSPSPKATQNTLLFLFASLHYYLNISKYDIS